MKEARPYSERELIEPILDFYDLDLIPETPLFKALYREAEREIAWREGWNEAIKKMERQGYDRPAKNTRPGKRE